MDPFGSVVVLVDGAWPAACRRLRDERLYPEAVGAAGGDAEGWRRAWARAAVRDQPTLVLGDRAVLVDDWRDQLAQGLGSLAADGVLALDGGVGVIAHVVTAEGAAALLDRLDVGDGAADALAARADGAAAVTAAVAGPARTVTVRGTGSDLDDLDPTDPVLVVPHPARVLASGAELAAALARVGPCRGPVAGSALGPAGLVREARAGDRELPLDDGTVFTVVDAASSSRLQPVASALVDVVTGRRALVLVAADGQLLDHVARAVLSGPAVSADRLLAYDGVLPGDEVWHVVGDELVVTPFWTAEACAAAIGAAEAVDAWGSDPFDPVPGHEVSLATVSPRLYAHVEDHVAAVVAPTLRRQWPTLEFHGLRDAFIIRYTAGDTGGLRTHHDVAQVSGAVRLNDGYEGGDLTFPRQGVTNGHIDIGRLLSWPSLVTHPHAAEPVRAGVKYGLTLWWEVPGGRPAVDTVS